MTTRHQAFADCRDWKPGDRYTENDEYVNCPTCKKVNATFSNEPQNGLLMKENIELTGRATRAENANLALRAELEQVRKMWRETIDKLNDANRAADAEHARLLDVMEQIAGMSPIFYNMLYFRTNCIFCGARVDHVPSAHALDCLWVRAQADIAGEKP